MTSKPIEPEYAPEDARALELSNAETLMKGIRVPSRPTILVEVLNEQARPEPNLKRMARLISSDVALSAGTLRVVNSAFFGLRRKIGSIDHAVRLIGPRNVTNVVTALMLQNAFGERRGAFMDAFWEASNRLALIAAVVARRVPGVTADEAYAIGLFADCGVPMMLRRFSAYPAIYEEASRQHAVSMAAYEDEHLGTEHTVVGYMVGKTWHLPDVINQCILLHHDVKDFFSDPDVLGEATPYLAALHVAMHLRLTMDGDEPSYEWRQIGGSILAYLNLPEDDLDDLAAEVERSLEEESIRLPE